MSEWYSPRRWWEWLNGEDITDEEETEAEPVEEPHQAPPRIGVGAAAPPRQQGEDFDGARLYLHPGGVTPSKELAIIRARPRSMDQAPLVADKIKGCFPVTVNLEGVDESMARRIVDFIGGVTYALDGSIKKAGRAVFICSPNDIPIADLDEEEEPQPEPVRDAMFERQIDRRAAPD
jgi:cell division inhibitor SepF